MKKQTIKEILDLIKYKLVSADLKAISDGLKEKGKQPRDWISVKSLAKIFEDMAKERSDKSN